MASARPIDKDAIIAHMESMSTEEAIEMLITLRGIRKEKSVVQQNKVPENDDELWEWIRLNTGYEIPRVPVCDDHCSPFDFIADFFFERERSLLLMAGRENGKCVSADSLIYDSVSGRLVDIESVVNGQVDRILTMDKRGSINTARISGRWATGRKECFRVTTLSGRSISVTPEHPFMTSHGWIRCDDLEVGESIAIPASIPMASNPVKIPETHVDLLAIGLYDPMLNEYGVGHEYSYEKIIPDIIFQLDAEQIKRFLSIFWMCDGYVTGVAGISLASKDMIEQLQHLLLRFSVQSRIRHRFVSKGSGESECWELTVYGNCIEKFANAVNLWGYKHDNLCKILAKKRCPSAGRPAITPEFMAQLRARMPQQYAVLLNEDLWWDPVVSIESVGERDVYDLTMIPTSSFVANDIIVHNTLGVAIVHFANSELRGGCESCTFGAIEAQAIRAYKHLQAFTKIRDEDGVMRLKPQIADSVRRETTWKNGSAVEILVGSKSGVNSPHPQKVHADEVDLMDDEVWQESRAQPVDTLIPTPSGWTRMGDLCIGDYVFGRDGNPHMILATYDLGVEDSYRMEFVDGRSTECAAGHLWLFGCKKNNYLGGGRQAPKYESIINWNIYRTDQLGEVRKQDLRGGWKYKYILPENSCVEYPEVELPLHPYILGVLLGDGCLRRRLANFRSNDQWIINRVNEFLPVGVGVRASFQDVDPYPVYRITRGIKGKNRTPNPVVEILEQLNLEGTTSHTKFIPECYLRASVNDRIELLRGLMDTDGSCTKDPYLSTVSLKLAQNVRELVLSLGGRSLLRRKRQGESGFPNGSKRNCGYIYEVSASFLDINPFSIPRKANKVIQRRRLNPSLKSVTLVGSKQMRCITVSAEDGIYLTEDFIPTHNSMASSKTLPDGSRIRAQDVATSTRKSSRGKMQQLIDEVKDAEAKGHKPAWKLYASCVFEIAQEVPDCRRADPIARKDRLTELGLDPCSLCDCEEIVKGEWVEDEPRTLASVCRGKFFKSRGWMEHEDVVGKFHQNSQAVWEAQQECRRPSAEGLYLPTFTRERFCVREWVPRPEYGPIYQGVDWGGSAESAVIWIQGPLHVPVQIMGFMLKPVVVPAGGYVAFEELYEAGIGAGKLADRVVSKELYWRRHFPGWRPRARFADVAGRQQRDDWREHDPPLRTHWYISRDFDPTIKRMQDIVEDKKFFVDAVKCPNLCDEIESWRQKNGKEVQEFQHLCSAMRYCCTNVGVIERRQARKGAARPIVEKRADAADPGKMSIGAIVSGSPYASERWRESYGMNSFDTNRGTGWREPLG